MKKTQILYGKDFFAQDRIPIRVLRRDPQEPYPFHKHDFWELVVIQSGTGIHFTRESRFPLNPGDVFIIHGDISHGYGNLSNLKLTNIIFNLDATGIKLFDLPSSPGFQALFRIEPRLRSNEKKGPGLSLSAAQLSEMERLIDRLEKELDNRSEGSWFMSAAALMNITGTLARHYSRETEAEQAGYMRLGDTLGYIENNLDTRISIDDLCGIAGMSESSLLRNFKRLTGTTPVEYHLGKKIDKARNLLLSTNYSITFIAMECGFNDSNYFSRQFRKFTGASPRDFRRQQRCCPAPAADALNLSASQSSMNLV